MFVVGIFGGLASQMSQYTFRTALERHYPDVVFKLAVASDFQNIIQHNGFELDRVFGIKKDTADWYTITKLANFCARNDWKGKILNKYMLVKTAVNGGKASQITLDDPSIYYPEIFELDRIQSKLFWGDWSERYFEEIVPEMKNIFTFQKPLNGINLDLYHSMTNCNSVAIHVRGGDYLTTGFLMLSIEYYKKAISYIMERISNPQFYIFTDDKEYVKNKFEFLENKVLVNHNSGKNSYIDMQLMSSCKHIITANSGFSQWAARLMQNPDKITITPSAHTSWCKYPMVSGEQWIFISDKKNKEDTL